MVSARYLSHTPMQAIAVQKQLTRKVFHTSIYYRVPVFIANTLKYIIHSVIHRHMIISGVSLVPRLFCAAFFTTCEKKAGQ